MMNDIRLDVRVRDLLARPYVSPLSGSFLSSPSRIGRRAITPRARGEGPQRLGSLSLALADALVELRADAWFVRYPLDSGDSGWARSSDASRTGRPHQQIVERTDARGVPRASVPCRGGRVASLAPSIHPSTMRISPHMMVRRIGGGRIRGEVARAVPNVRPRSIPLDGGRLASSDGRRRPARLGWVHHLIHLRLSLRRGRTYIIRSSPFFFSILSADLG